VIDLARALTRPFPLLDPPFATLSSDSSLDYRRSDASTADDGFAASPCVRESAKVVLGGSGRYPAQIGFLNTRILL
jgi:hypothetical protein